jgi:hypothetical protein
MLQQVGAPATFSHPIGPVDELVLGDCRQGHPPTPLPQASQDRLGGIWLGRLTDNVGVQGAADHEGQITGGA